MRRRRGGKAQAAAEPRAPRRAMWRGLALILVPSLALFGTEIFTAVTIVPDLQQSQAQVAHTFEAIGAARALDHAIQDAERGQRGFLITGDEAYLDPYRTGVEEGPAKLRDLRQLSASSPVQQRRIAQLETEIRTKLAEMQQTIDVRRKEGFDAARQIVKTELGSNTMRTITGLIEAVIGDENKLLNERQARLVEVQRGSADAGLAAAALALAVIFIGGTLLTRTSLRLSRSQASLRASEERFRHLVSGVKDYAIFMLDPGGRVVSWNEGAERIKGYREGEIIGCHFSRFFTPEDAASGLPERLLETATAEGRAEAEGWRVRKDGSRFWANGVITALRDAEGTLRGFTNVIRDITERRQHRIDLEHHRAELAQLQKMEALGQLTGGVAHDFNNLLTTILGNVELLQNGAGPADPERTVRLLGAVRRAAEQGAALTQRLLAFSRRQALAPQIVDANKLVGSMSALLHRTLGESIAIETVLAAGLWRTQVDPNQLEIAMLNLAVNARDAMPDGGKLTIETGNTFLDEGYSAAHSEVAPGQYVMIALSDTGEGISEETLARAFDPFFTTKPEGKGTGLGLSQVHGFVKQSRGHVKLYSEPGQGTTIKIYLPRTFAPSEQEPSLAAPTAAESGQCGTVLLVEDNADVRRYIADALASLGYGCLQAADGPAAIRLLEEHRDVAVLLTDVGLPGLNGRQLAEQARRREPHLKVLFTTGYARNAIVRHGILDRGVDVLVKPFTVDELGRKLQRALQHEPAGQRTAGDNAKREDIDDRTDFR